jgi:hypothetical protein
MRQAHTETLIDTWLRSEEIALEYANRANKWLREFYSEASKTFYIQFTDEDVVEERPGLHTATYHIGSNIYDHEPHFLSASETADWKLISELIKQLLDGLNTGTIQNVLPLQNFGLLPIFSTSYRAEFMWYMNEPLQLPEYAIVIRRILFALYSQQQAQWSYPQKVDKLHPYLLFRCTKSLLKLRELLNKANADDIKTFVQNLTDEDILVSKAKALKYDESELERVYGIGDKAANFTSSVLGNIANDVGGAGEALIHTLEWIEDLSVNGAFAEIARSKQSGQRSDPSSLAFALLNLSVLNAGRHEALLSQGMRLIAERCEQGTFPATVPFNIDEKGRALFVPSIEIANALLTVTLSRINRITDEDLGMVLHTTSGIQSRLIEDYNQVDINLEVNKSEKRYGWCSDRAPSPNRIDSWITAQVLLFFMRHIETLRWAKRRHILKEYSWVPHSKIKITWADIIDPDDPGGPNGPKAILEQVVKARGGRSKAPVFLLYGPPGTSKTTLVEGIANEMKWDLVKLSPSDFVVESLDRIEYRARKIFKDLMNLDNCIILMDELDALLKDRDSLSQTSPGSIMEFVAPALLPKIQELRQYTLERNVAVFFVTNYYERIDRALSRSGRIDNHLVILPYSGKAQIEVAEKILDRKAPTRKAAIISDVREVLENLPRTFVYTDIEQIIDALIEGQTVEAVKGMAKTLGVSIKAYPVRRVDAYREFVAFLKRRQDQVFDNRQVSSITEGQARIIVKSTIAEVQETERDVSRFLEAWDKALEKHESI